MIILAAVGTVFQPEVTNPKVSLRGLGSSNITIKAYLGLEIGKADTNVVRTFLSTYFPFSESLLAVPVLPATS